MNEKKRQFHIDTMNEKKRQFHIDIISSEYDISS